MYFVLLTTALASTLQSILPFYSKLVGSNRHFQSVPTDTTVEVMVVKEKWQHNKETPELPAEWFCDGSDTSKLVCFLVLLQSSQSRPICLFTWKN